MNLCNELASRAGATRVSLGWVRGDNVKLKAMSHTEEFDKKQELSVQLMKVMEECFDNDEIVQYEPGGTASNTVTREAQVLSRMQGNETVLSLPLRRNGETVGVITLEYSPNSRIGAQAAMGLAVGRRSARAATLRSLPERSLYRDQGRPERCRSRRESRRQKILARQDNRRRGGRRVAVHHFLQADVPREGDFHVRAD